MFLLTHNSDPPKKEEVVDPKNNGIDGSNQPDAATQIAVNPVTPVDAQTATNPPPTSDLIAQCTVLKADKKWSDLHTCGERLLATDQAKGKEFMDVAAGEIKAESISAKISDAITSDNLREAKRLLDSIPNSVYHQAGEDKYNERDKKDIDDETRNANKMLAKHDCAGLAQAARQATSRSEGVADAVRAIASKCVAAVPTVDPAVEALKKEIADAQAKATQLYQANDCQGLKNLAATSHKEVADAIKEIVKSCKAPVVACDPTEAHDKGIASVNLGQYAAALSLFEQALACKPSQDTLRLAYLAACHSKNAAKARLYFSKLPSVQQKDVQPICLRDGIQVP